jgi:hypothetical protein
VDVLLPTCAIRKVKTPRQTAYQHQAVHLVQKTHCLVLPLVEVHSGRLRKSPCTVKQYFIQERLTLSPGYR